MISKVFDYYFQPDEIYFANMFNSLIEDEIEPKKGLNTIIRILTNPNLHGEINEIRNQIATQVYQNALIFGIYIIRHEQDENTYYPMNDFTNEFHNHGSENVKTSVKQYAKYTFKSNDDYNTIELTVKNNDTSFAERLRKNNKCKKEIPSDYSKYPNMRLYDCLTGQPLYKYYKNKRTYLIKIFNTNFLYHYLLKYSDKDSPRNIISNSNNRKRTDKQKLMIDAYNTLINDFNSINLTQYSFSDRLILITLINNSLRPFEINSIPDILEQELSNLHIYENHILIYGDNESAKDEIRFYEPMDTNYIYPKLAGDLSPLSTALNIYKEKINLHYEDYFTNTKTVKGEEELKDEISNNSYYDAINNENEYRTIARTDSNYNDLMLLFNLANECFLDYIYIDKLAFYSFSQKSIYNFLNNLRIDLKNIYKYILSWYFKPYKKDKGDDNKQTDERMDILNNIQITLEKDFISLNNGNQMENLKFPELTTYANLNFIFDHLAYTNKNMNLFYENIYKKNK